MKRIAPFMLLALTLAWTASLAWSLPPNPQRENRSIGENQNEAKKAAKDQRKLDHRAAKKQHKAMKRYNKAQHKASKQQKRRYK